MLKDLFTEIPRINWTPEISMDHDFKLIKYSGELTWTIYESIHGCMDASWFIGNPPHMQTNTGT